MSVEILNSTIQMQEENKKNVTLLSALENFPNYLFIRGKAKNTSDAYTQDVIKFNNFLKKELNNKIRYVNNITIVEIEQYKSYLLKKMMKGQIAPSTVERRYNSLKVFFQFLNTAYGIKDITFKDKFGNRNSVRNWNDKYEVNKLPPTISNEDLNKLFDTIYNSHDKNIFRDIACFELLLGIGCRKSELQELKWKDINFFNEEIFIERKKTRNSNIVKLNKKSLDSLTALKSLCLDLSTNDYVFRANKKTSSHLSSSALHCIIKKWVNKAKINPKISTHYFRHTFITNCIKDGISYEKILKYTGHSNINGLKPYSHLVAEDTAEVAEMINKRR